MEVIPTIVAVSRQRPSLPGVQIAAALPLASLVAVLSALDPYPSSAANPSFNTQDDHVPALVHLLLLLPPALHAAVMHARFPSIASAGSLTITHTPDMSECASWPRGFGSFTTQALAAACTFAGGHRSSIWIPPSVQVPGETELAESPPFVPLSTHPFPLHLLPYIDSDEPPQVAEGSAGSQTGLPYTTLSDEPPAAMLGVQAALTRLNLATARWEPRGWSAAMGALRALRDVRLHVATVSNVCVPSMVAGLAALPELRWLKLRAMRASLNFEESQEEAKLLAGLFGMEQLSGLTLDRAFECLPVPADRSSLSPINGALPNLSRLTGLTQLSLRRCKLEKAHTRTLADAVARLPRLQDLRVADIIRGMRVMAWVRAAEAGPGTGGEGPGRAVRGALLRQLTALSLEGCRIPAAQMPQLLAMLKLTAGLRSLDLRSTAVTDSGLDVLAGVLPQMRSLTALDVGGTESTGEGVCSVLRAAQKLRGHGGGAGLRSVGVATAAVGEGGAQEVAGLLGALPELEILSVAAQALGQAGLRVVLQALSGLPRLRELYVSQNLVTLEQFVGLAPLFGGMPALRELEVFEAMWLEGKAVADAVERAAPEVCLRFETSWVLSEPDEYTGVQTWYCQNGKDKQGH